MFAKLLTALFGAKKQASPQSSLDDSDIMVGYEFRATLSLNTPLALLQKDGEVVESTTQPEPLRVEADDPYGRHGIWIPKPKSWRELGVDVDETPIISGASDIGQVDPAPFRKFLIEYRSIIENTELSPEDQLSALDHLSRRFPEYTEAYMVLYIDFNPHSFSEIKDIRDWLDWANKVNGVSRGTIVRLRGAGYSNPVTLAKISPQDLEVVLGIGPKMARTICNNAPAH